MYIEGSLRQLKKANKQRYITLFDKNGDYEDERGVLEITQNNHSLILKMEDEKSAKALLRKYMRQENISYKIEMISLQQLIKEALDASTHRILT